MLAQTSKFRKYLETTVNILLIVVCLSLLGILVKRYFVSPETPRKTLKTGDKISASDFALEKGRKSVLLFLQSNCKFCEESGKFYSEISAKAIADTKIIAVFSSKDAEFESYLNKSGLRNLETRKVDFAGLGIEGTPTLAIVSDEGNIEKIWKGILSPNQELEVQRQLGFQVPDDWFIEETEIADWLKKESALTVIDIRNRETFAQKHFAGAKNIPMDELPVRAVNELSPADTIVVYGTYDADGEDAQQMLAKQGFRKVYILRYKFL
jgi:rhodanese-related sulfurtransferase